MIDWLKIMGAGLLGLGALLTPIAVFMTVGFLIGGTLDSALWGATAFIVTLILGLGSFLIGIVVLDLFGQWGGSR